MGGLQVASVRSVLGGWDAAWGERSRRGETPLPPPEAPGESGGSGERPSGPAEGAPGGRVQGGALASGKSNGGEAGVRLP